MVNSTRGYAGLQLKLSRNRREVYHLTENARTEQPPAGTTSSPQAEELTCTQNESHALTPNDSRSQPESKVTFVVQEGSKSMDIHPKEMVWVKEEAVCVQSQASVLGPQVAVSQSLPQVETVVKQSVSVGEPQSAGDKLEGYVPRYFLKEDGKDDLS